MQIFTHKQYDKAWSKLSKAQQKRISKSVQLFMANPDAKSLRIHQLKGEYYPQYSLSAGGDLRIHYLVVDEQTVMLVAVGTHSQLYG